jgi:hypothetical protein
MVFLANLVLQVQTVLLEQAAKAAQMVVRVFQVNLDPMVLQELQV